MALAGFISEENNAQTAWASPSAPLLTPTQVRQDSQDGGSTCPSPRVSEYE